MQEVFKSVEKKMNKSLDNQLSEYASIRAGRANAGVLDKITVVKFILLQFKIDWRKIISSVDCINKLV